MVSGTTRARRYLDFSSPARQPQHRPPAPAAGRRHPGAGRPAVHRSPRPSPTPMRGEAARLIAELAPGDLDMVFFTNGGAEATENAMRMARLHTGRHKVLPTYRSYHGATGTARSPLTGDPRRWPSEPGAAGIGQVLGPVPLPLAVPRRPPRPRSASGRSSTWPTSSWSRARTPSPPIMLETVVGTNGILVPPPGYLAGRAGAVRPARHRDDLRRGDGRLRPLRRVVRRRPLERRRPTSSASPRASTRATSRSAAWSSAGRSPTRSRSAPTRAGSPTRATRWPARRPSPRSPSSRRRGSSSTPARWATEVIGPALRGARGAATRASARSAAWACSGPSSWCGTGRPASRSCRSTRPARPPRP